jgi:hypothetical protein
MVRSSLLLASTLSLILLSGCANREGVAPSQNKALDAISPTIYETGAMQRSLDTWLKEDWNPIMASEPTTNTTTQTDGTIITTKTEPTTTTISVQKDDGEVVQKTAKATQIITTTKAPDGTVTTKTEIVALDEDSNEPFTLQKYADRWKSYLEIKEKLNAGQPKAPSHLEKVNALPVIGQ